MEKTIKLTVEVTYTPELFKNILDDKGYIVDQPSIECTADDVEILDKKIETAIACGLENLFDDGFTVAGKADLVYNHDGAKYTITRVQE